MLHGPMVGQVTDLSQFWFRTDDACEIGVEISGHSGREKVRTSLENRFIGVLEVDGFCPALTFLIVFVNGEEFWHRERIWFRTFPQRMKAQGSPSRLEVAPDLFPNMSPYGTLSPNMIQERC